MSLEENGRYIDITGNKVHMRGKIDGIILHFSSKIIELLGIEKMSFDEQLEILEKNHVLNGLTDNDIMPAGWWHQETGKCLGGNTGGVVGKGEKYEQFIKSFDIKIGEFNIASNSENFIEAGLSNLSHNPFRFNGEFYASVEAFWQSLKFEDGNLEQHECRDLFGVESKKYGNKAKPKEYFQYIGNTYKVGSSEHQQLMKMALREQLKQNKNKLELLLLTGESKLIHQPKKKDGSPHSDSITIPGEIFSGFLMELREEFKMERK